MTDLDAIRARHVPIGVRLHDGTYDDDDRECAHDGDDWPCDARQMADLLDAERQAHEQDAAKARAYDALRDGGLYRAMQDYFGYDRYSSKDAAAILALLDEEAGR